MKWLLRHSAKFALFVFVALLLAILSGAFLQSVDPSYLNLISERFWIVGTLLRGCAYLIFVDILLPRTFTKAERRHVVEHEEISRTITKAKAVPNTTITDSERSALIAGWEDDLDFIEESQLALDELRRKSGYVWYLVLVLEASFQLVYFLVR